LLPPPALFITNKAAYFDQKKLRKISGTGSGNLSFNQFLAKIMGVFP